MSEVLQRTKGVVKFFNVDKGFGFCRRDDGEQDVFVHANELKRSGVQGVLQKDDRLEFEVEPVEGKGPKARDIKRI